MGTDTSSNNRISICLIAYDALPLIDTTAGNAFGGIETEFVQVARELARVEGFDVRLVVRHERES